MAACPGRVPGCTGQRGLPAGPGWLTGPSWPSGSCRGERNSSSWKATVKPSLEYAGHPSRCQPGTTLTVQAGVALGGGPRDLLAAFRWSCSPLHVHPSPGLRASSKPLGPSLPGSCHLTTTAPSLSCLPVVVTSVVTPWAGQHPLCSLLHLFACHTSQSHVATYGKNLAGGLAAGRQLSKGGSESATPRLRSSQAPLPGTPLPPAGISDAHLKDAP